MNDSKITVRYGLALFLEAREQEVLDRVRYDMELLLEISARNLEIRQMLESPVINSSVKNRIFHSLFSGKLSSMTLDFLKLVCKHNREEFIPGMCRHYIHLYKKEKGIMQAHIRLATRLNDNMRSEIIAMIGKAFHAEIELEEETNRDLIGGFILRVEEKQLDASVRGKLNRIKKELKAS